MNQTTGIIAEKRKAYLENARNSSLGEGKPAEVVRADSRGRVNKLWSSTSEVSHKSLSSKEVNDTQSVECKFPFKDLCAQLRFDLSRWDLTNLIVLAPDIRYPSCLLFYNKKAQEKIDYCKRQINLICNFRQRLLTTIGPACIRIDERVFEDMLLRIAQNASLTKKAFIREIAQSPFIRINYSNLMEKFKQYQLENLSFKEFGQFVTQLRKQDCLSLIKIQEFIQKCLLEGSAGQDKVAQVFDNAIELTDKFELSLIFRLMLLVENLDRTRLWWEGAKDRVIREKADKMPFEDMQFPQSQEQLEFYLSSAKSLDENARLNFCNKEFQRFPERCTLGNDAITKSFWEAERAVLEYQKMIYLMRTSALDKALKSSEPKSLEFYLRLLDPIKQKDFFEIAQNARDKGTWDGVKVFFAVASPIISLAIAIFAKIAIDWYSLLEGAVLASSILLLMTMMGMGVFLGAHFGFKAENKTHQEGIDLMRAYHMQSNSKISA